MRPAWQWAVGVVAGLALGVPVAEAYAPSPAFIMSLVAKKRAAQKLPALRVVVRRTAYADSKPVGNPVDVTITYRAGGKVRREWTDAAGKHVRVSDAAKLLSVDGETTTRGTPEPDLLDALWATGEDEREPAMSRAMAVLREAGVNESEISFARMDGRIAWVIGAEPKNLAVSQAWVDKDEFLPLRLLRRPVATDAGPSGPVVDQRLRNWGSPIGGEFYPGRVETWTDGVLTRVDELVKVDVSPKVDDKDFKVE